MEPNEVTTVIQEGIYSALDSVYGMDEMQGIHNGAINRISCLLKNGTVIKLYLEVIVDSPSQEAQTEIM